MLITLLFFDSFFHLTQLWPNGLICRWAWGAYPLSLFLVSKKVALSAGEVLYAENYGELLSLALKSFY